MVHILFSKSDTPISGAGVTAKIANVADFSGLSVTTTVNTTTNISGQSIKEVGTGIVNPTNSGAFVITSLSGGSTLFSGGPLLSATLRNSSGNNVMYVGGVGGTNQPYANNGIEIYANESLTLKVPNFNLIAVVASTSGQRLSYIGLSQ